MNIREPLYFVAGAFAFMTGHWVWGIAFWVMAWLVTK